MPVVIRTRPYDESFYAAVQRRGVGSQRAAPQLSLVPRDAQEEIDELFPD
jgi:uncharacterized protein